MRLRFCPPVNDTGAAAIGLSVEEAPKPRRESQQIDRGEHQHGDEQSSLALLLTAARRCREIGGTQGRHLARMRPADVQAAKTERLVRPIDEQLVLRAGVEAGKPSRRRQSLRLQVCPASPFTNSTSATPGFLLG